MKTDHIRTVPRFVFIGAAALVMAGCATAGPVDTSEDSSPSATPTAAAECPPDSLEYVCGMQNPEEIVRVGSTRWLITSSVSASGPGAGSINLIDSEAATAEQLFPGESPSMSPDETMYPDCPSIDLEEFEVHGLSIRETSAETFRLYATTHGSVEAIQAWELDASGEKPAITWVGCVPLPDDVFANGVAMLADGGFVTTKFAESAEDAGRGSLGGGVLEWHPGEAVTPVPDTEVSGANGIELSSDERYMYVAAFKTHEIVRFDRGPNPEPRVTIAVDVGPDNLRWTPDGTLLTAGSNATPGTGWSVVEVDPSAMTATKVAEYGPDVALQNASTALQVDDAVWIGAWRGDRVGYYPAN